MLPPSRAMRRRIPPMPPPSRMDPAGGSPLSVTVMRQQSLWNKWNWMRVA